MSEQNFPPVPMAPPPPAAPGEPSNEIRDAIKDAIGEHRVILFMKGTPDAPACGFSARTVAILHVRRMHDHADRQSDGVGKDVPFAAVDHFLGRISARATRLSRLDRLAVDDASSRARLPASGLPRVHQQHVVDGLPYPVVAPRVEIPLHRRVWWEILGQQTPLAAGLGDVEDGIHDIAQAGLARPPGGL